MKWMEARLPIAGLVHSSFIVYPMPSNLNYWWSFGSIAGITLIVMIFSGIFLAMQYHADVDHAFDSVERIMRDVNYGWLMRYMHQTGASLFFAVVYIHIFRGFYYGSYKSPREVTWATGVIVFLMMMAASFMGYVLVWGQMSFWAATVITNLFWPSRWSARASPPGCGVATRSATRRSIASTPALPDAIRDLRRGGGAHLSAAPGRTIPPASSRDPTGHASVPALLPR